MMNQEKSMIYFLSIGKINSSRNEICSAEIEITSVEMLERLLVYLVETDDE